MKNNIRSLVREAFKIRGAKYIIVDRHGIENWSLEPVSSTACVSVSKSKLVECYRQTIGIPMGTDCVPQLANLFLFHYKYSYIHEKPDA